MAQIDYREYMRECIDLARRTDPNIFYPHVGAFILSAEGVLISTGVKSFLPGADRLIVHAERNAINRAGSSAKGAYLVTTLEPCLNNHGRERIFSSCADLIVKSGIKKVAYGLVDNSSTFAREAGLASLRSRGVEVIPVLGFEKEIIRSLMSPFFLNRR